jgi:hypothetical protein
LPDTWLLWNVRGFKDISKQSLSILQLMAPFPEVLIIGSGSQMQPLDQGLQTFYQAAGVAVEVLDTVSLGIDRHRLDVYMFPKSYVTVPNSCVAPLLQHFMHRFAKAAGFPSMETCFVLFLQPYSLMQPLTEI